MLKENQICIDGYLSDVRESSYKSANMQKYILVECLEHINKPVYKIKKTDIINYFRNILNKKNIIIGTKNTYRLIIRAFFNKIDPYLPEEYLNDYLNPVPKFKFTVNTKKVGKKSEKIETKFSRGEERKDGKEPENEILKILEISKKREFRDFIIFGILAQTGMRISECLSIKIEDVNFKKRVIDTGLVNGAMKSYNEKDNTGVMFFFRENFSLYLKKYILWSGKQEKEGWLFGNSENHLSDTGFRRIVKKHYGQKWQRFHCFRHSIITYFEKDGLSRGKTEMLMNHTSSSMEDKHYRKLSIGEKRAIYDEYFPYKEIPYF